jgi:stress response protein YsnF
LADEDRVIPVVEETAHLSRRTVPIGRVRVETITETRSETITAELASSEVEVERVPVGREVETAPEPREEDGVTIIPVVEEVLVVEKRLVLREELHVRRRRVAESAEVTIPLRRQRVVITRERQDTGESPTPGQAQES